MYLCLEWDNASASLEASTEVKGSPRTSSVPGEVLTPPPSLGTCSVSATDTDLIMCFFLSTQFHQEGQDSSVFPSCYELESLRLYIFFSDHISHPWPSLDTFILSLLKLMVPQQKPPILNFFCECPLHSCSSCKWSPDGAVSLQPSQVVLFPAFLSPRA